jgi:hypothetical protein
MKRSREENEVVAGAVEDRPLSMVQRLFPDLDSAKLATLTALASLVRRENARTNLISRKDVEHVEEHHIVMSLLMAKGEESKEKSFSVSVFFFFFFFFFFFSHFFSLSLAKECWDCFGHWNWRRISWRSSRNLLS